MNTMDPAVARLRSCSALFLHSIEDIGGNALRVIVEEGRVDESAGLRAGMENLADIALEPLLREAHCVSHAQGGGAFELVWDDYIAYAVRNESYAVPDRYEQWEGKRLRKYSKSCFLDYVAATTFASVAYPGPFTHWGLVCEDHIIDVASTCEPAIRSLPEGPGQPGAAFATSQVP